MSEWITDRLPTYDDLDNQGNIWNAEGELVYLDELKDGDAWMKTNRPKPYVEPKRLTSIKSLLSNSQTDKQKQKRLYIAYSKDWGLWCIHNTQDPTRCIPLDGYTDENNDMQRKAAQDVCDMFEWNLQ